MKPGHLGAEVAHLQRLLKTVGLAVAVDAWYGNETTDAVTAFQRRVGLVADGIAGPKTLAALNRGEVDRRHLRQADLQRAAERLGTTLAAMLAVNNVFGGEGFLADGRPVIRFERHALHCLLAAAGVDTDTLAERYGTVINPARGGYAGGTAEWSRLAAARQVTATYPLMAEQACAWGPCHIMGHQWQALGYDSVEAFTAAMHTGEADQLDAFVRHIETDPALHKSLKGRKWAEFARLHAGPDYKAALLDHRLARIYERFAEQAEESAA